MSDAHADALVLFGATGDLAYQQIFPALQAMVLHGRLNVPVIGVARPDWTTDQLCARMKESLSAHGGVDADAYAQLAARVSYVSGDYEDPATFDRLREALGPCRTSGVLPRHSAQPVRRRGVESRPIGIGRRGRG